MSEPHAEPVVEMTDISISFPGVKALDSVSFRMFPGEVHSLMGENGSPASTTATRRGSPYRNASSATSVASVLFII